MGWPYDKYLWREDVSVCRRTILRITTLYAWGAGLGIMLDIVTPATLSITASAAGLVSIPQFTPNTCPALHHTACCCF
jgi:hypothetical protein